MIHFKLVDEESFESVLALQVSDKDKKARFVAPNVRSLADAWLYRANNDVFPQAIFWEQTVVGFLLLDIEEEGAQYFIWRMMIGQEYQGKGYGRKALQELIKKARADKNCTHLIAHYVQGNDKMKHLLTSSGFEEIGREDNEIVMRLDLEK